MAIESKINKLVNKFRVYKPKTIDRAIELLRLFGDAKDEEIVRDIELSIRLKSLSAEEMDNRIEEIVKGALERMNEV